jgi:hypothetical protein
VTKYDCESHLTFLRVTSRTRALENTGGKLAVSAEAAAAYAAVVDDAVRQPHVRRLRGRLRVNAETAEVVEVGEDQPAAGEVGVRARLAHAGLPRRRDAALEQSESS